MLCSDTYTGQERSSSAGKANPSFDGEQPTRFINRGRSDGFITYIGCSDPRGKNEMTLIVETIKRMFEIPEEGLHLGRLVDVEDLGMVETSWGKKPKTRFVWMLNVRDSNGEPIRVFQTFTASLHEKAGLRRAIKGMLGKDPGTRYDLETLLGKQAMLNIERREYEGNVYASVTAVLRASKESGAVEIPANFQRAKDKNGRAPLTFKSAPISAADKAAHNEGP